MRTESTSASSTSRPRSWETVRRSRPRHVTQSCTCYQPSTVPGSHLPHAWVGDATHKVSTLDLAPYSRRFTLHHRHRKATPCAGGRCQGQSRPPDPAGDRHHRPWPEGHRDIYFSRLGALVAEVEEDGALLVRPRQVHRLALSDAAGRSGASASHRAVLAAGTMRSMRRMVPRQPPAGARRVRTRSTPSAQISPTPLLLPARNDVLTPAASAVAAYEKALEPKRPEILPGGHFDAYVQRLHNLTKRVAFPPPPSRLAPDGATMAGLPEMIRLLYRADWTRLSLSAEGRSETDREPLPRVWRERWSRWSRAWPVRLECSVPGRGAEGEETGNLIADAVAVMPGVKGTAAALPPRPSTARLGLPSPPPGASWTTCAVIARTGARRVDYGTVAASGRKNVRLSARMRRSFCAGVRKRQRSSQLHSVTNRALILFRTISQIAADIALLRAPTGQ